MKTIVINSQKEFDKITKVKSNEEVIFEADNIEIKSIVNVFGILRLKGCIKSSWESCIVARASSQVHNVAWGSSQVHNKARDSSQVHNEAWGSSQVHNEAWGSSQVHNEAWDSSQVHNEAWGSSQVHNVAWASSQVHNEAWGSSQVHNVAWGSSQVHNVAWDSSQVMVIGNVTSLTLHGFSVASIPFNVKLNIKKAKTAIVQRLKHSLDWFERNGIRKTKYITIYKRVSHDFKTQEGTKNETLWKIGTTPVHPNWNPTFSECGDGKFHACSRPYFCDEFRDKIEDRYIAVRINQNDLYDWPNPTYPHKIAFRVGEVLYECDKYGKRLD